MIPPQLKTGQQQQVGGDHYKGMPIDPVTYSKANNLDCHQFSIVKYVSRHKSKGGIDDIKKAMHFLQMLLESDYGVLTEVRYQVQSLTSENIGSVVGRPYVDRSPFTNGRAGSED